MSAAFPRLARRETLTALQGLRGLAALLVVSGHAVINLVEKGGAVITANHGVFLGNLGVRIFFTISGFVMVYAHRQDFGVAGMPRKFALRRLGRIVPLYWIMTLIYGLNLIGKGHMPSRANLVQSLLFIPYQNTEGKWRPILGQGWSLNYEMMFYLVFGLCMFFPRGIAVVMLALTALVLADQGGLFQADAALHVLADPVVLYFIGGLLLGLARPHITKRPGFTGGVCLSTVALLVPMQIAMITGPDGIAATMAAPVATLYAVAACCWADDTGGSSVMKQGAKILGNASYSIYLTHTLVLGPIARVIGHYGPGLPVAVSLVLMLLFALPVGIGVYWFVERPIMRWWASAISVRDIALQPDRAMVFR